MDKEHLKTLINDKKYEEALNYLTQNQKAFFNEDPIETVKDHIFLLIELEKYNDCRSVIEEYKDYPYLNMEVEDYLLDLTDKIQNIINRAITQKLKEKNIDENGVDFNKYHSNNEGEIMGFLYGVYKSLDCPKYIIEVRNILSRNISDRVNFMCLSILFDIDEAQHVDFVYKEKKYSLCLKDISFPFSRYDEEFLRIYKYLELNVKDVSIQEAAKTLLNTLRIEVFPQKFPSTDVNPIIEALLYEAKKLYGQETEKMVKFTTQKYIKFIEENCLENTVA